MFKISKTILLITLLSSCGNSGSGVSGTTSTRSVNKVEEINSLTNKVSKTMFKLIEDVQEQMKQDDFEFIDFYLAKTNEAIAQFRELTSREIQWLSRGIQYNNYTDSIDKNKLFSEFLFLYLNKKEAKESKYSYLKKYFPKIVLEDDLNSFRDELKSVSEEFVNYFYNKFNAEIDNLQSYDNIKDDINRVIDNQFLFNEDNKLYYEIKYSFHSLYLMLSVRGFDKIYDKIKEFMDKRGLDARNISLSDDKKVIDEFKTYLDKKYLKELKEELKDKELTIKGN